MDKVRLFGGGKGQRWNVWKDGGSTALNSRLVKGSADGVCMQRRDCDGQGSWESLLLARVRCNVISVKVGIVK